MRNDWCNTSAFAGPFHRPSIGNRRTNYRHSPDLFLLCGSTDWLSDAKKKPLPPSLQSVLQIILFKQSERTAFENFERDNRPDGAGRRANDSREKEGNPLDHQFDNDATSWFKESVQPPSDRLNVGLIPPAPAMFRRNTGERSSTDDSALESRK